MHTRINSFWSYQLLGWLCYVVLQSLSFGFQQHPIVTGLVLSSVFGLIGISLTAHMRQIYLSPIFQKQSVYKLFLVCVFTCLIATLLMDLLVVMILRSVFSDVTDDSLQSFTDQVLTNYFQLLPIFFIWTLLYYAIKYFRQFKTSEVKRQQLQSNLREAELNTLKGQLNPHFMFNSLNNIKALMLENVESAREGISSLAEVLRYSLTTAQDDKTTLERELEIVCDFISLARLQYENRLKLNMQIAEQSRCCLIPVMSLQMMVENAIKHGIAESPTGGELKVISELKDDRLSLKVSNPGMLSSVQIDDPNSTGTGLKNIQQRINLLYGSDAKFELKQFENEVVATLCLPKEF